MSDLSYSARIVATWLDREGFEWKPLWGFLDGEVSMVVTGIAVQLEVNGQKCDLKVETMPSIAGPAFAETALTKDDELVGRVHENVRRLRTPEELFSHMRGVLSKTRDNFLAAAATGS